MRIILLLIGLTLLIPSCRKSGFTEMGIFTPYTFNPEKLNGRVRVLTERYYLALPDGNNFSKGPRITLSMRDSISWSNDYVVYFDKNGLITSTSFIDENDKPFSTWNMEISNSRITEATWTDHGVPDTHIRLRYTENGVLNTLEQYRAGSDSLNFRIAFTLDSRDIVTRWDFIRNDGDTIKSYLFRLDGDGRRTGYQELNRRGRVVIDTKYTYNDRGSTTEQLTFDGAGIPHVFTYTYTYDQRGNWIRAVAESDKQTVIAEREILYY
ncbi:MAG: hypothetical protein ACOYXB_07490 [Bacteroidota bacterium]